MARPESSVPLLSPLVERVTRRSCGRSALRGLASSARLLPLALAAATTAVALHAQPPQGSEGKGSDKPDAAAAASAAQGASNGAQADTPAGSATEAKLQKQIGALASEIEDLRLQDLRSITVNGKALTPQQVRREAVFLVGARRVEEKIAEFFLEEWRQKAIADGRKASELEISDEEIIGELEGMMKEVQIKYPGLDFWEAVRAQYGLDKEGYLKQARQVKLWNRVFFPGPAKNWPMITREAIMASTAGNNGVEFWNNIEKTSVDPTNGEPRELPAFWLQLCRTWVQNQLKKWSDIQYPADGLDPQYVLSVNGMTWSTDDAFAQVRGSLYPQDVEKAMLEVVIREALRQELEKQGAFLSDEAFRAAFDEYRKEYDDTPFNTEVIAMHFKGYPSLEAFRARWRLMKSYEDMIAKDINDDNLQAHAEKFKRFFADGQTNCDVIQFLGRDLRTGAWMPNGMEEARKRAEAAFKEIKDGANFDEVMDKRGEWFENDTTKGRLGFKPLNQIRQALRETEFTDLVMGYSVGAHLFYDAEVGQVVGPIRGTEGWYVARVTARQPARGSVSVSDTRQRELVKQDYVTHRFLQWANEVLSRARIE